MIISSPIIAQQLPGGTWVAHAEKALTRGPEPALGGLFDPFGTVTVSQGFATEQGFANGLSRAVGGLTGEIRADFSRNAPHVADSVAALGAVFEAVTGSNVGAYVGASDAALVAQVVKDVSQGLASLASELGAQLSGTMASMGAAIPFLGEAVGAVIQIIEGLGHPRIVPSEENKVLRRWYDGCASAWRRTQPGLPPAIQGTGPMGRVEPADLFRAVLFAERPARMGVVGGEPIVSKGLPAGIAGILVLLCGDAAHGYGYTSKGWASDRGRIPDYKIPTGVRQSLWKLCQSLMSAVRDPQAPIGAAIVGDNGRSAMPMIAQILSDQWQRGNWSKATIKWLGDYRISANRPHQIRVARDYPATGSVAMNVGPCSEQGFDLAEVFYQFVLGWDRCVKEAAACGIPAREHFAAPVAAELKLGPAASRTMLRAASQILKARSEPAPKVGGKGGGAILAIGGAAAAALVLRRLL